MTEFRLELEKKIEEIAPQLSGKIRLGLIEEETPAPFGVYTIRNEPVRTKLGIAGFVTHINLTVYDTESKRLDTCRKDIILGLDGKIIAGRRILYTEDEHGVSFEKASLNAYTITFKIR